MGVDERKTVQRLELFMKDLEVDQGDRKVIPAAAEAARKAEARGRAARRRPTGRPWSFRTARSSRERTPC